MFELGRMCVKIAGRDAGKRCLVIDVLDDKNVMIDGETRRRKCNIKHLEPLDKVLSVNKNAPKPEVIRLFKEMGIELKESKPKKKLERPKRLRKKKEKPVKQSKTKAKESNKEIKNKIEEKKPEPAAPK
ncbi:MAG TPA: 50S ribosomal protein L14e [Candidatus Nanoarchaeia archaeon]|nr:50S ribosomal protein L14e [Candidatus Nanoarchaeia archaeon]